MASRFTGLLTKDAYINSEADRLRAVFKLNWVSRSDTQMARALTKQQKRPPRSLLALAVGAAAFGAVAIGALAIGQIMVGRLAIKKARFGSLEVDELTVRRLNVMSSNLRDGES